jgi:hypothetical protein
MIAAPHLRREFVRRIYGRVDLSSDALLSSAQRVHHVLEGNFTDDEQVDITASPQRLLRSRSEHEREHDAIRELAQRIAQHIDHTDGLHHQALQLGVDR